MSTSTSMQDLEAALAELPVLDIHTHLVGGKLSACGLHDVLLYHMVISDLYAAGCPSGARLTEYPRWPGEQEAHARIAEALPFLPHIANTSSFWGVRIILADLFDWREPIDAGRAVRDRIRHGFVSLFLFFDGARPAYFYNAGFLTIVRQGRCQQSQ